MRTTIMGYLTSRRTAFPPRSPTGLLPGLGIGWQYSKQMHDRRCQPVNAHAGQGALIWNTTHIMHPYDPWATQQIGNIR
jgi:hypothetical protein